VRVQRLTQQNRRIKTKIPIVSLVGYTSAGKSTLLNTLTRANVESGEELFTTLDPVSRRLYLEDGFYAIITDTVGFIDKLPVQLIKAFRTTLEDVASADLLLLVVDVSKPDYEDDIRVVEQILEEIHADSIKRIYVFNKIDKLSEDVSLKGLTNRYERSICISAAKGTGIAELKKMIFTELMVIKHTLLSTKEEHELHRAI
jgi:GTP-binding protein HflX